MQATPYNYRNNEFRGDMAAWMQANAEDNGQAVQRLKNNLRRARREELTTRQRQMLQMRFERNMKIVEIAAEQGVNKSTVSRTLMRAQKRLGRCLRYTF